MKKILLLSFIGLGVLATGTVSAQSKSANERMTVRDHALPIKNINTEASKKTRAGSRWYDPLEATLVYRNGDTTGLDINTNSTFLWKDSTMRVRYTQTGGGSFLGGIFMKAFGQVLDPFAPRFNNHTKVPQYIGEIAIRPSDSYTIDSVAVAGFYRVLPTKTNIVDTLIISVTYGNFSSGSNVLSSVPLTAANAADIVASNCYNVDTMRLTLMDYSLASYGIKQGASGGNVVKVKRPLVAADSGGRYFSVAVNLNVPAGNVAALSYEFVSGDTWIPNVDSVADFNFFRAYYTEEQLGELALYEKRDWNSTHSFETDTTGWGERFVPNYLYIGASGCSKTFTREQFWTLWKLSTNTNGTVGTVDQFVKGIETDVYPNPASTELNVDLTLTESAKNVQFELTNALGQVVLSKSFGATFANEARSERVDISSLSTGLYIYTIHADGKKTSGKLMVK